jgi:hypothetical protein
MRDFLKGLASIFVVLGGIASAVGLFLFLFSVFSSGSSGSLGVYIMLSGLTVTLTSGAVYLLAEIAESVRPTPQAERTPVTAISLPPNAR